ncbi:LysR family transcriptional regulator [Pseudomonas sp. B22129]|uniref:LysR family transcriptional regulator n=1 Tax=Pseudomonas sp. B22129 TaxID=3235111 RepID=UPI0037849A45
MSKQISNLEQSLGIVLFERTRRGSDLTLEGYILLTTTQTILKNLERVSTHCIVNRARLKTEKLIIVDLEY